MKHPDSIYKEEITAPSIQSISNFCFLCVYANDCLDVADLEMIVLRPAF